MNTKAFTLFELLAVIVIMGLIAMITVPTYLKFIEKTSMRACENNIRLLEYSYKTYLEYNEIKDTKIQFYQYLNIYNQKVCPENGNIIYKYGIIYCTIHSHIEDDNGDEPVPYL